MSRRVNVSLGERSYSIEIGAGLLRSLGACCRKLGLGSACLLVSDSNVFALYGDRARRSLKKAGFAVSTAVVPAGETSKSPAQLSALYGAALDAGLDRSSFIVALGGGVVGDLAGYLAATFLRGIRLVQVPTSLLAMVDSAVGGKTGINLPQGKNLVGAFHQPVLVLADTRTLKTLPRREYVSGLAEVVKYGVIRDAKFLQSLEKHAAGLARSRPAALEPVIAKCCGIKADVVRLDEREAGLRAILNFGHTMGHAIEKVSGYGRYLHGEAVAMGMVFAGLLSVKAAGFREDEFARLVSLLRRLGLPVHAPRVAFSRLGKAMSVDKKGAQRKPRFVLARRIGRVMTGCDIQAGVLRSAWERWA